MTIFALPPEDLITPYLDAVAELYFSEVAYDPFINQTDLPVTRNHRKETLLRALLLYACWGPV